MKEQQFIKRKGEIPKIFLANLASTKDHTKKICKKMETPGFEPGTSTTLAVAKVARYQLRHIPCEPVASLLCLLRTNILFAYIRPFLPATDF
jgi:hypothetical protein